MFFDQFTRLCADRGTTPEAVAAALGLPPSFLPELRAGAYPSEQLSERIATYLGVDQEALADHEHLQAPCRISCK